jgi:hypothetical protein
MFGWKKNNKIPELNTGFVLEILPSGKLVIIVGLDQEEKPDPKTGLYNLSKLINLMLSNHPQMVAEITESIKNFSSAAGWSDKGNIIIDQVVNHHKRLLAAKEESNEKENDHYVTARRPIIKPSAVLAMQIARMNQSQSGE